MTVHTVIDCPLEGELRAAFDSYVKEARGCRMIADACFKLGFEGTAKEFDEDARSFYRQAVDIDKFLKGWSHA